jgi:CelD/BcsL family acetyltransferase involved in cellulose biosynthesis
VSAEWLPARVALRYRLGEITLYTWARSGYRHGREFYELAAAEPPLSPPPGALPAGDGPYLLRSLPVPGVVQRISVNGNWIRYVPHQFKRFYVDLNGDFDGYLKRFSSKSRSTLTRKVRRFADESGGTIDWKEYRSPAELEEFYRHARKLSEKTYQERLLDSGLPASDQFRVQMREASARSEVRAYLLFIRSDPAAYVYCPVRSGVLVYEYVGFNPAHQHLSPGTVLQYLILKRLFDEGGYRMFDFTEGEGQQKAFFATAHAGCADVYFYRDSSGNRIAVRAHAALDDFSGWLGRTLDRIGLKAAIRRLVRRAA